MKNIYTPEEACRLLKIGRTKFYQILHNGTIEFYKNGNRYLIPENSLISFIENRTGMQTDKGGD